VTESPFMSTAQLFLVWNEIKELHPDFAPPCAYCRSRDIPFGKMKCHHCGAPL
jgi:hypothetical protein